MVDTPRVVLGDRLGDGNIGFHVARPGYNALTDNTLDASKFSMSTDWPYVMRILNYTVAATGVWTPLVTQDYWPLILWRYWVSGANLGGYIERVSSSSATVDHTSTAFYPSFRINNGVREFAPVFSGVSGVNSNRNFIIMETNLPII